LRGAAPVPQRRDAVGVDDPAVLPAREVFEQDLQRVRQPREAGVAGLLERGKTEVLEAVPAEVQRGARVEGILRSHLLIILYSKPAVQVGFLRSSRARNSRATTAGSCRPASTA